MSQIRCITPKTIYKGPILATQGKAAVLDDLGHHGVQNLPSHQTGAYFVRLVLGDLKFVRFRIKGYIVPQETDKPGEDVYDLFLPGADRDDPTAITFRKDGLFAVPFQAAGLKLIKPRIEIPDQKGEGYLDLRLGYHQG